MKITQSPAQKFRWAKRSLSIVVCTAMLLTALVFVGSVPASAGLLIEGPPEAVADPIVFVVPETVYMTPAIVGTPGNLPQFFMNNDVDGMPVVDPGDTERQTGKVYIEVPGGTNYELYFGSTLLGTLGAGGPWALTIDSSNWGCMAETAGGQGSVEGKEWKLRAMVDGAQKEYFNYTAFYRPVWVPSVHGVSWTRGGGGPQYNSLAWISGLHKNWDGFRAAGADDTVTNGFANVHGRINHPTATASVTDLRHIAPLLGSAYFDTRASGVVDTGSWGYMNGRNGIGYTQENTSVGGTNRTAVSSNTVGAESNGQHTDEEVVYTPDTGGYNTNTEGHWGVLHVDTSRHTNFGSIPNFAVGQMVTWMNAGRAFADPFGDARFRILASRTGDTDTNRFIAKFKEAGFDSNMDTSTRDYPAMSPEGFNGGVNPFAVTDRAHLDTLNIPDRGFIFFFGYEHPRGVNNDILRRTVALRIQIPANSKAKMREKIENIVGNAHFADLTYRNALKSAVENLGNPSAAPNMGWVEELERAVYFPSYAVGQHYHFDDANNYNMTTGNGTASAFSTTTGAFIPESGASYRPSSIATTGSKLVSHTGAVTGARDTFVGYKYMGMVVARDAANNAWTDTTAYPASVTSHRQSNVKTTVDFVYQYAPVTYNIKYDGNGGTEQTPGSMDNTAFRFNERKTLATNDFVKPGYTFAGWSTTKNGTLAYGDGASVINLSANPKENNSTVVTLYAMWTLMSDITVSFDAVGGDFAAPGDSSKVVRFDAKYGDAEPGSSPPTKAGLPTPTRAGYTFEGWWDAAIYDDGKKITATTVVKNDANPQTLYAKWAPEPFDVVMDVNGGTPLQVADSKLLDVELEGTYPALPVPEFDGYDFRGWSTAANDPGVAADPFVALVNGVVEGGPVGADVLANRTLYAQWTPKEYTVTFDPLGGAIDSIPGTSWTSGDPAEITVKFGQPYPDLAIPDLSVLPAGASSFEYWYVEGGDGSKVFDNTTVVTVAGHHALKAKWVGILSGVTFEKDGGVFTPTDYNNKEVVAGEEYGFLPTPVKPGYAFLGWYDAADNVVDENTVVPTADPHKIYAKWEAKDFTVTFEPEGGILDAGNPADVTLTKTVKFDTAYKTATEYAGIPLVKRDGYDFDSWNLAPTGAGTAIDENTILSTAKDHKLYARWTPNDYKVTFDTNGGPKFSDATTDPDDDWTMVTFGAAYGTLADAPARMGYIFDGWWTDPLAGTKVRATTPVTDFTVPGHNIYAHWTAIPIVVTFTDPLGNNKFTPATKKVALATEYGTLPADPVLEGYVFDGWLNTTAGIPVDETTLVPDDAVDHDLEAQWVPATFTVTLDTNGGPKFSDLSNDLADDEITVTFDTAYDPVPAPPARPGFSTFLGWSLDGVNAMAPGTVVTNPRDHAIIALWDGDTNTVNYDASPSVVAPASDLFKNGTKYGSALAKPDGNPGYDFVGWCTQTDFSDEPITEETEVFLTGTTDFYAKWEPKTLKVSFDTGGGTALDSINVTFGGDYDNLPADPELAGYTFVEWQTEGGDPVDGTTAVTLTTDHKLIALWEANKIKVNFDPDGGAFQVVGEETRDVMFGKTYGKLFDGTDAPLPVPVLGGYAIDGWYTEPDGEGKHIKASSEVKNPEEHTLYPNWVESDLEIKLYRNYDAADETFRAVGVEFDAAYGLALSPLTRKGYTFEGWFVDPAADPATDTALTPADMASDATLTELYAIWTIKTPKVTFKLGYAADPADEIDPQTVVYGAKYSTADPDGFPVPTRTGYEFDGWWNSEALIGSAQVTADTVMDQEEDHFLYAKWKPAAYEITFDTNSGLPATIAPKEVTVEKTYGGLPTPVRDGYTFGGWALDTDVIVTASTIVTELAAHTLTAKWTPATYKLTLNNNYSGAPVSVVKDVVYLEPYGTLGTPERVGYNFEGWSTDKADFDDGTLDDEVTDAMTFSVTGNQTLFAQWSVRTDIKVTLDPGDGTFAVPADAEFNDAELDQLYPAGIDAEPAYTGYEFEGWYTKATGGTLVNNATKVTNGADHTLYARWTPKSGIKVTLDPNDGVSATMAPFDVTFTAAYGPKLTQKPVRPGYVFAGWYDAAAGGDPVNKDTIVTNAGDHKLFAQWTDDMVTVTFDFNDEGATAGETRTYRSNETYDDGVEGAMPLLSRTGYTGEWCVAKDAVGGKTVTGADKLLAGITTLYACWTPDKYTLKFEDTSALALTPNPATKDIFFGKEYGKLATMPANPGYEFKGWYDAATGGSEVLADKVVSTTDATVTVYARWEITPYTLTLNNNYDGAPAAATKSITYGVVYGELGIPAVRVGYNFLGWSAAKNDAALANEETAATVAGAGNKTLYAQWEAKNNIEVTLNSNGGSPVAAPVFNVTYGLWYKNGTAYNNELSQVPTRTGFEFIGWYDEVTGGREITAETPVINENAHILYARWDSEKFGLHLDPQVPSGTDAEGLYVETGKPYSYNPEDTATPNVFPVPTRVGYTSTGWYDAPTGGTKVEIDDIVPAGAKKLYAYWDANVYNVKFDVAGGTPAADQPVTFDSAYGTLPATTRDGYQFAGWFTASGKEITETTIFDTKIMTVPAEHTLAAKWTPNTYTVTLNAAGGILAGTGTISATYDRTYSALPTPTRTGYTFDGWFTAADVKVTPSDTVKVTADTTLTAKWTLIPPPNTYLLTVVRGTGGGNYLANASVTITADAAPAGQVFAGWAVTAGTATVADTANPNTSLTMANGSVTVEATYRNTGPAKKMIFTTKYESKFWNWIMFIFLFGWIWMWFVK